MRRGLKEQLKNLKNEHVSPRPDWLKSDRARLLSQISNTMPMKKVGAWDNIWLGVSILLPQQIVVGIVRPLVVLLIVALVGTSGWVATVDASYEALPGDWLYPAKRAVEKTKLKAATILGNESSATKLHAEFAVRRASEVKSVVKKTSGVDSNTVSEVVNDLKTEIKTVNTKLEEIKNNQGSAEVAREVQKNTEQIQSALKEVKDDLASTTSTEGQVIVQEITEAKNMAKDTTVKTVEVLVAKHQTGEVSKEEVANAIGKTLDDAVGEMNENKQSLDNVKIVMDIMTQNISASGTASSTDAAAEMFNSAKVQTAEAAVKTNEAAEQIDKKAGEIKSLVESGDLSQAISAMKEMNETAKEAGKISDTALTTAQQVLSPAVVNEVKEKTAEAAAASPLLSGSSTVKVLVTTTTQSNQNGSLPVSIIVTTTPVVNSTTVKSSSSTVR